MPAVFRRTTRILIHDFVTDMLYSASHVRLCAVTQSSRRKEIVDICQIAAEKYAAAEKSPLERNNEAAAHMIKVDSETLKV